MKLFKFFKKKTVNENNPEYNELKKMPRKMRKKAINLLKDYDKGIILTVNDNRDQKALILEKRRN